MTTGKWTATTSSRARLTGMEPSKIDGDELRAEYNWLTLIVSSQGTNGGGLFACFNGCANRIGCTAFSYYGTTTSGTAGSGRC